jgi:serine/threonine protein kinase/tetratricopeptide (TPR) repeat protein
VLTQHALTYPHAAAKIAHRSCLMVGQTISHYRILEKLGAGGMGVVYKATDLQLERTVALKFLPSEVALTERERENLLREARAASSLDHPNTGVIYGLEESADHQLYIVMGYYEGETLVQRLAHGQIPTRESLDLAIQIASGLSAAHARNIVHRDIKPANIIITKQNVVKIVDFGLARVIATSSATQSLQTSGTLPYMAPEQVLAEPIDQRCDVWALGVVLVQMVTGKHPFLRDNTAAMTFAILNQPPAALEAMPRVLRAIAYRSLSKEPGHRYPSAKEMLGDLESARSQITSTPDSVPENALTQTTTISARQLKEVAERASTPLWQTTAPQKPTSKRILYVVAAVILLAVISLLIPDVRERLAAFLTASNERHIAVLPFDNIGNDPANEAVAQGLMESLTSQLSNLDVGKQSLWVVPSSVVRSQKISDPALAAKELGANLVVKGSIQRTGSDVHLTVDLIDAKNLRQIGSSSLEDRTGDLASLQDEAVARLARLMNLKVTAEMLRATGGKVTPAAYESYLKSLGYIQRYDKPGNLDIAIAALNDSVQTDPRFALGFAQLGEAYRLKHRLDPNPKWLEEATVNSQKAIQLDNRLPVAYSTLGHIHEDAGKHDLAAQEYQLALKINARDAMALGGLAHSYENAGRIADAEQTYQRAAAIRPDYWDGYNELGLFYDRQNRYPEAIAQLQKASQLTPDNAQVYSNLGAVYLDTGNAADIPKALAAFNKSIELSPSYGAYANLGYLYLQQHRFDESVAMTEKALQINDKDYIVWENLVLASEWQKQWDKAGAAREKLQQLLQSALSLKPQDPQLHASIATQFSKKKQRDEALSHIKTALALAPEDPTVLANVAEAYETLGDRSQALHYIDISLRKGYALDALKLDPELQGLLSDPNFHSDKK